MPNPKDAVATVRNRRPFIDHLIRAFSRYQADAGDRLAAAVTYFGFLSFFPLIALCFSVAGFVVDAYPDAQNKLIEQINTFLPGLSDKLDVTTIGDAKVATGIVGLAGLLYSGLGWIDALREAIRTIWHHNVNAGNIVVKKLLDVAVLIGLGLTLVASVAVTGISSAAMNWFLDLLNLDDSTPAKVGLRIVGILLALLVDLAVFMYLFTRLPRLKTPMKRVFKGALLGAVGLEILKVVGSLLVSRTTNNPVYGAFAVVVGLLVWINLVSRFLLFIAAWTVTAPYDTDVAPSGTADKESARAAGIPEHYADNDPDEVPTTRGGGAPAPLAAALQGKTPPQDEAEGSVDESADRTRGGAQQEPVDRKGGQAEVEAQKPSGQANPSTETDTVGSGSAASSSVQTSAPAGPATAPAAAAVQAPRPLPSEASVRAAGRVGAGVMIAGAAGVAVYGAKVLLDAARGED